MSNTSKVDNQAIQFVEIKKLDRSPLNVRKTETKAALDELKASIVAHGLIQNLVVVPGKKGRFEVIAGGRRLEALMSLQTEGKLPADFTVPCQVVSEEHAAEMSLAENTVRQAMHPADEFEAFAALAEQGQSSDQIAERFGTTEKHVLQRLKLGRVAPELLKAYRAGTMNLETLMAFTITDDRKRQIKVYKSLVGWQKDDARHIRDTLTEKMLEADSKLTKFVGLDLYVAAGGETRADLFGEDVYLENPELLNALVTEKLRLIEQGLQAEGWGWIEVSQDFDYKVISECTRIRPEPLNAPQEVMTKLETAEAEQRTIAELIDATEDDDELDALYERDKAVEAVIEAIEQELESFIAFDPEQMKSAGCYVSISQNGELRVEKGLVRKQDVKKMAAVSTPSEADETPEPVKKMSEPLKRDLEAYRLQVAQVEIAKHPAIAFDLLVFKVACGVFDNVSPSDGPDVSFRQSYPSPSVDADTLAVGRLEKLAEGLSLKWMNLDGEAARFEAFRELSEAEKLAILAHCTALTLKLKLDEDRHPTAYDISLSLTGANVAEYWRPTATNYLSRINREQLLAIGQEIIGETFASRYAKAKKGELVVLLDKAFAKPDAAINPETVRRIADWLPEGMAFRRAPESGLQAEPKPAKPKRSMKVA